MVGGGADITCMKEQTSVLERSNWTSSDISWPETLALCEGDLDNVTCEGKISYKRLIVHVVS